MIKLKSFIERSSSGDRRWLVVTAFVAQQVICKQPSSWVLDLIIGTSRTSEPQLRTRDRVAGKDGYDYAYMRRWWMWQFCCWWWWRWWRGQWWWWRRYVQFLGFQRFSVLQLRNGGQVPRLCSICIFTIHDVYYMCNNIHTYVCAYTLYNIYSLTLYLYYIDSIGAKLDAFQAPLAERSQSVTMNITHEKPCVIYMYHQKYLYFTILDSIKTTQPPLWQFTSSSNAESSDTLLKRWHLTLWGWVLTVRYTLFVV